MQLINYFRDLPKSLLRKPNSGKLIGAIDGLRFFAILPVVLQHFSERIPKYNPEIELTSIEQNSAAIIGSGGMGVYIFFAISGFILCLPFAKRYLFEGKPIEMKNYFKRRLIRLEPPYIIWMSVFAIVLIAQSSTPVMEVFKHLLASITYSHNLIYQTHSTINPVAWSLEVEIQFYILAPLLSFLFFSIKSKVLRRSALIISLLLFTLAQSVFGWHIGVYRLTLLGNIHYFLLGFIACELFLTEGALSKNFVYDLLGIIGLVVLYNYSWQVSVLDFFLFIGGISLLFLAAFHGRLFSSFSTSYWIMAIGGMCYTIYLVHLPLAEAIGLITSKIEGSYSFKLVLGYCIYLPTLLSLSIVSYKLIERPFMNIKLKKSAPHQMNSSIVNQTAS